LNSYLKTKLKQKGLVVWWHGSGGEALDKALNSAPNITKQEKG
jgi:hypothetical protein